MRSTPEERRTRSRAYVPDTVSRQNNSGEKNMKKMRITHEFNVAVFFKLAHDERTHLGMLFPSVESRSGGKT